MEKEFKIIRQLIADKKFDDLSQLDLKKPEMFNWVKEVFERIHVADTPDDLALLWTDGLAPVSFSFSKLSRHTNQLLNFLRGKDIQQHDVILTQLSLQPITWLSILATIKGGFRMIPAASILGPMDIKFRFEKLMPEVVIADAENATKIDEAEILSGKKVKVKIIAEGIREGWYSLEDIEKEDGEAEAAETRSDDPLFLF